jgi:hypothetical protein
MSESIEEKLPEVKAPKTVKTRIPEMIEVKEKIEYSNSKRDEIDDELMKIQEKLRELNG